MVNVIQGAQEDICFILECRVMLGAISVDSVPFLQGHIGFSKS